ncbi:Thaumatin-like protein [Glycine soja]
MIFYNKCQHLVWPKIQPSGCHGCAFDTGGRGRCIVRDYGGSLFCNDIDESPLATLAEFTMGNEYNFYDMSLVDGEDEES